MTATLTIYGIASCDTMRKARKWLADHAVAVTFHDYRKSGLDRAKLESWTDQLGWEKLLNRSGTTFRRLAPELRENLDTERAIALMLEHPAMIRRPVLEGPGILLVGFRPDDYAAAFSDPGQAS
ncbi:ArsC family reductase [Gluconobacter roseus]|uniref:Arsenate reductase n=1 Tax=Gluconobacter roseus NBRC 3990 TaxID=1307950 RepID=A0A4Y3M7E4_9PROT|nr:ArsC family reductase [Gluconobacter roseus]KXV44613.1 ArsC family transcriptional regulator [Gluconobacter roseus]GEB04515.1 arsenate reductase [Gluconobacter roseus NBRC 3990]GLP92348.1 arsenate reductase [Gluconobacter roseus NBRC 3990]